MNVTDDVPNASASSSTRRGLIGWLWGMLGATAIGEMVWIGSSFLKPRPKAELTPGQQGILEAGPVEAFAAGSVTAFPAGSFYLVRLDDGGFLAVHRECSHLGCTVPWVAEEEKFMCPCHASSFDITGEVLSPPAPRALDLLAVRIENNVVKVDLGMRMQRQSFHPRQAVHG